MLNRIWRFIAGRRWKRSYSVAFWKSELTCNVQGCVVAPGHALVVARHAPVDPRVLLLLALHRPQKKQTPVWQEDSVGRRVRGGRLDRTPVSVPLNVWLGVPPGLAAQSHRFVPRHRHGNRVLRDSRLRLSRSSSARQCVRCPRVGDQSRRGCNRGKTTYLWLGKWQKNPPHDILIYSAPLRQLLCAFERFPAAATLLPHCCQTHE